jgi:hypothetical protein
MKACDAEQEEAASRSYAQDALNVLGTEYKD